MFDENLPKIKATLIDAIRGLDYPDPLKPALEDDTTSSPEEVVHNNDNNQGNLQ